MRLSNCYNVIWYYYETSTQFLTAHIEPNQAEIDMSLFCKSSNKSLI